LNITYLDTADELVERAAALIADGIQASVSERGRCLVALSGGNTPKPVYERLTRAPYGPELPWDKTVVFFGDERMVPCDNPESNFRMACDALLDHVSIPPWNVHRVAGEMQADVAAEWYARQLAEVAGDDGPPRFDLMLLGLGPDGHTASLFPGTDALENVKNLAVHLAESSEGAEHAQDRVTVTYPVINASRRVLFLVAGADKAEALQRVRDGDLSAPAARVNPVDGSLEWLVVKG